MVSTILCVLVSITETLLSFSFGMYAACAGWGAGVGVGVALGFGVGVGPGVEPGGIGVGAGVGVGPVPVDPKLHGVSVTGLEKWPVQRSSGPFCFPLPTPCARDPLKFSGVPAKSSF